MATQGTPVKIIAEDGGEDFSKFIRAVFKPRGALWRGSGTTDADGQTFYQFQRLDCDVGDGFVEKLWLSSGLLEKYADSSKELHIKTNSPDSLAIGDWLNSVQDGGKFTFAAMGPGPERRLARNIAGCRVIMITLSG